MLKDLLRNCAPARLLHRNLTEFSKSLQKGGKGNAQKRVGDWEWRRQHQQQQSWPRQKEMWVEATTAAAAVTDAEVGGD